MGIESHEWQTNSIIFFFVFVKSMSSRLLVLVLFGPLSPQSHSVAKPLLRESCLEPVLNRQDGCTLKDMR